MKLPAATERGLRKVNKKTIALKQNCRLHVTDNFVVTHINKKEGYGFPIKFFKQEPQLLQTASSTPHHGGGGSKIIHD